jgi:prepilin-type N-terminal cleavage/methylation domain-containing protein
LLSKLRDEAGYSLVEVMVAIMILSIAIIPMVSMFDAGLRAAVLGSNYDQARALAGKQIDIAKSRSWQDVRDNYPVASSTPPAFPGSGVWESGNLTDAAFPGFTYKVRKEYVAVDATSIQPSEVARRVRTMMQVTVTVSWTGGKTYSTTALVSRG